MMSAGAGLKSSLDPCVGYFRHSEPAFGASAPTLKWAGEESLCVLPRHSQEHRSRQPPYVAGRRYSSLPVDDRGFIRTEPDSRRIKGHENIFAVGDTADFPIKQAFLALLQADAAADHLAAEIEGKRTSVDFEPMSMCVMEES